MRLAARTDPAFFEAKYRDDPHHDPWHFADDGYEQSRYRSLDRLLGGRCYGRAFEPGCSIGAFSRLLARRCDEVDAIDVSATAIREAAHRNRDLRNVHHAVGAFPHWPFRPGHRYDLVCLVEIGYYFAPDEIGRAAGDVADRLLVSGGDVLVSHWTGDSEDHVLGGLEAQRLIARSLAASGLEPATGRRIAAGFVAERWHRPPVGPVEAVR
jgi:SAM-dependent methyltransferase